SANCGFSPRESFGRYQVSVSKYNIGTLRSHPDLAHTHEEVEQVADDEYRKTKDDQRNDVLGPHGPHPSPLDSPGWRSLVQGRCTFRAFRHGARRRGNSHRAVNGWLRWKLSEFVRWTQMSHARRQGQAPG